MEPAHYTDPLEEALSHGSQRVAQLASLAAAMAQVVIQRRALEQARKAVLGDLRATRVVDDQERLLHRQAQLSWAPAHDAQWLAQAGFTETAGAWAGAAAYADTDPAAAAAVRKCEIKLHTLHPYAMARYDRLRQDGLAALDAMREAAPLFARPPHVRTGEPVHPRSALSQEALLDDQSMADRMPPETSEPVSEVPGADLGEERGQRIVERLQASARSAKRPELGPDELAMILEAVTNLPKEVIDKLAQQTDQGRDRSTDRNATLAEVRADSPDDAIDLATAPLAYKRTSGLTAVQLDSGIADTAQVQARAERSPAQVAAESFPSTAADAVQAAGTSPTPSAQAPARIAAPDIAKRRGPTV